MSRVESVKSGFWFLSFGSLIFDLNFGPLGFQKLLFRGIHFGFLYAFGVAILGSCYFQGFTLHPSTPPKDQEQGLIKGVVLVVKKTQLNHGCWYG